MVLRAVIFGAGAVLLGLEIVGSRLLAPFFGSSVYVWGSLISIFLAALSVGYYAGGRVADRWPHRGVLASGLLAAGVLIMLLPLFSRPLLEAFVAWDLGPRLNPLVTSVLLFAPPSILLAATSPFAIKLEASDLATVGSVAGVLYALSTAGSIAGTLLTAFFLIPAIGVQTILYILGGTLVGCSALLLPSARTIRTAVLAVIIPAFLVTPALRAPARSHILYEKDSLYHRIRVVDQGPARYLVFNRSFQGGMYHRDAFESPYPYTDYMHLAWVFRPTIRRMLVIGLGAGAMPKRFARDYPEIAVDVVELDPAVVDVARDFFAVKESGKLRIVVQDGRLFLRKAPSTYDFIVIDAYFAEGIPFHLATREFFELARSHLNSGGVVAANIVGALDGDGSKLFRALYKTYGQVFPGLYLFPVGLMPKGDTTRVRTIVLMATPKPGATRQQIVGTALALQRSGRTTLPHLDRFAGDYYDRPIPTQDVPILTDDYAPVDILPVYGWEPARRQSP